MFFLFLLFFILEEVVAVANKDGESEEGVDSYIEESTPASIEKVISFDIYIFR